MARKEKEKRWNKAHKSVNPSQKKIGKGNCPPNMVSDSETSTQVTTFSEVSGNSDLGRIIVSTKESTKEVCFPIEHLLRRASNDN
eukprot:g69793.t1